MILKTMVTVQTLLFFLCFRGKWSISFYVFGASKKCFGATKFMFGASGNLKIVPFCTQKGYLG